MTATQIELYNFPITYAATAEPRESGIRVVIEDTSCTFCEITTDTCSVSQEISWSAFNIDGMRAVQTLAYALAAKLRNNQFGAQN